MTFVPSGASIAAIIAAKKKRERENIEEEKLTKYKPEEIEGWEFKIVRSHTGKFRNYNYVQKVVSEEAQHGWEMLEKFDNSRIRFKRRVERRSMDSIGQIDPYRTTIGIGEGGLVLLVLGGVFLTVGIVLATIFYAKGGL